jgi:adenylate kinase family enzyme
MLDNMLTSASGRQEGLGRRSKTAQGRNVGPNDASGLARAVVVGNSGSGKSTFARRLGAALTRPVIDLDLIHWAGSDYGQQRIEHEAREQLLTATAAPLWIVEGVYTWMVAAVLDRATALIWLDVSWNECQHGLMTRGRRHNATETQHAALLKWAEEYWDRDRGNSHSGHMRLYLAFSGLKVRFGARADAHAWVDALGLTSGLPTTQSKESERT